MKKEQVHELFFMVSILWYVLSSSLQEVSSTVLICAKKELGDNTYTTSDESPFYQAQESNKLKHLSFVLSLHWFSARVGHKCNQILVPDV